MVCCMVLCGVVRCGCRMMRFGGSGFKGAALKWRWAVVQAWAPGSARPSIHTIAHTHMCMHIPDLGFHAHPCTAPPPTPAAPAPRLPLGPSQVLDIGGGFCGGRFGPDGHVDLGGVPEAVNSALDAYFPDDGEWRLL